ncbi:hypothetical protein CXP39_02870 [Mesoplasma syrphidae]|uniref:Uncharacterized protein n=1 Tax=Mesoplasma syrphidae TaxID=225999 RepID=A0A2K9C610_9MOLU|nr:hypothetical protein [Mesoplasma syrphidae]AUF83727.1 hypothetical protein CXP39_02870 [Mesoplasma syrphidae]
MSKKNFQISWKLLKAQTLNYFTDPTNIVLNFVITSVTMLSWIAFKPVGSDGFSSDPFVLASAIAISQIRNSQHTFTTILVDWRDKKFFKTLSQTPLSKKMLYSSMFIFNWFINFLMFLFLFSLAMLFAKQRNVLARIDLVPLIIGFILNVILSNLMALVIVQIFKNRDIATIFALISYFGPMYLLGLGIPWNIAGQIKVLNIITYLFPHRYTINLIQASWSGLSANMEFPNVDPNSWLGTHGFGYNGHGWWLPALISAVWVIGFLGAFIFLLNKNYPMHFKTKKYQNLSSYNLHKNNINNIKHSNSLEELNRQIQHIKRERLKHKKQSKYVSKVKKTKYEENS